jgi:catalase
VRGKKGRLVANIAGSLLRVSRPEIIERSLGHFRRADKDLGERLKKAVDTLR